MNTQSYLTTRCCGFARVAACGLVLIATSSLVHAQLINQLKGAISSKSDDSGSNTSNSGGMTAGLMGAMGGKTGQGTSLLPGAFPASGSTANVAGVLQFCIKNNYLSGNAVASVKDGLMSKLGGGQTASPGYVEGAKGILSAGNGQKVSLGGQGSLKEKLTHQVCEKILQQGKSLL
jgi:hypothetical protein